MEIDIRFTIDDDDPICALEYAARTISVDERDTFDCDYYRIMLSSGDMNKLEVMLGLTNCIGKSLSKICNDDSRFDIIY
jgi:hypothetical protein